MLESCIATRIIVCDNNRKCKVEFAFFRIYFWNISKYQLSLQKKGYGLTNPMPTPSSQLTP